MRFWLEVYTPLIVSRVFGDGILIFGMLLVFPLAALCGVGVLSVGAPPGVSKVATFLVSIVGAGGMVLFAHAAERNFKQYWFG